MFFTGRSFKNELPEDISAKKIIEANQPSVESESPLSLYPSDSIVYGSGYVSPMEEKGEDNQLEKEGDDNA